MERYIGRYIEHISTATTGHRTGETGGTGQDVASEILSVGPIQQEDLVKIYNLKKVLLYSFRTYLFGYMSPLCQSNNTVINLVIKLSH